MVTITCKESFYDLKEIVNRLPGDSWQASEARAKEIDEKLPGYIEWAKPAPKSRSKKPAEDK